MKGWVDVIRQHGNKATHELDEPDRNRAESTVMFTAELLRLTCEMEHLAKRYAPGTRSISTSDLRYFSIDDGDTDIVDFKQAYSLTKASRSALTTSAWVAHMPCGNFK